MKRCDLDRATSIAVPVEGLAHLPQQARGPGLIVQHVDHPADGATPLRRQAAYSPCRANAIPRHTLRRSSSSSRWAVLQASNAESDDPPISRTTNVGLRCCGVSAVAEDAA